MITDRRRHNLILQWIGLHVIGKLSCVITVTDNHVSDAHCQHIRSTGHHRDL